MISESSGTRKGAQALDMTAALEAPQAARVGLLLYRYQNWSPPSSKHPGAALVDVKMKPKRALGSVLANIEVVFDDVNFSKNRHT